MKRLLIVDDEDYTQAMAAACARRGIEAYRVGTGREAVEFFLQVRPDVVLLDFHLPDMDGIAVYKEIKAVDAGADVYFISGNPTEDVQHKAEQLGAKGFFVKPVNLLSVVHALVPQDPFSMD